MLPSLDSLKLELKAMVPLDIQMRKPAKIYKEEGLRAYQRLDETGS